MKANAKKGSYAKELTQEISRTPPEYLPMLLRIVRSYRESVTLPSAKESLRRGWKEAKAGATYPVSSLWKNIDTK